MNEHQQKAASRDADQDEVLAAGTIIEKRFELLEYRGQGATGKVYKARNLFSDEFIAIKILTRGQVQPEQAIERFHREAKMASSLSHHGIVAVKAFGKTSEGLIFLAMEYLQGQTLAELISLQGKLKLQDLVNPISVIAEALAYAHEQGIVHRDIKPSNIMLMNFCKTDSSAKILDFGLAQLFEGAESQNHTAAGIFAGTPAYMSPERCRGENASPASDIYSFGCLLYEALTGEQPFQGASSLELMSRHINAPLIFPNSSGISDKVKRIISRCMHKQPAERYGSARDIVADLQHAAGEPLPKINNRKITLSLATVLISLGTLVLVLPYLSKTNSKHTSANNIDLNEDSVTHLIEKAQWIKEPRQWRRRIELYEKAIAVGQEKLKLKLDSSLPLNSFEKNIVREMITAHRILGYTASLDSAKRLKHIKDAVLLADKYVESLGPDGESSECAEAYRLALTATNDPLERRSLTQKSIKAEPQIRKQGRAIDIGLGYMELGNALEAAKYELLASRFPADTKANGQEIPLKGLRVGILLLQGKTQDYQKEKRHLLSLYDGRPKSASLLSSACDHLSGVASKSDLTLALAWNRAALEFNDKAIDQPISEYDVHKADYLRKRKDFLAQTKDWTGIIANDKEALALPLADYSIKLDFLISEGTAFMELGDYVRAKSLLTQARDLIGEMENSDIRLYVLPNLTKALKSADDHLSAGQAIK